MIKLNLVSLVLIFNPIFAVAAAIECHVGFSSVEAFVDCLDKYTVPERFYTLETYSTAQPSDAAEIAAWTTAVNNMLTIGCPGAAVTVVPGLNGDYVLARVTDSIRFGKTCCVLVESRTFNDTSLVFKRGWGFLITPYETVNPATRRLHFSAPHPKADANTPRQAASVFGRTGAKSLVVTGRHRMAYATATSCSVALPPDTYYKTDSSHDNVSVPSWFKKTFDKNFPRMSHSISRFLKLRPGRTHMADVHGPLAPTSRCMEKAMTPPIPPAQNTTFSCLVASVRCHLNPVLETNIYLIRQFRYLRGMLFKLPAPNHTPEDCPHHHFYRIRHRHAN